MSRMAMVSSPTYDATGFSGNPDTAQAAFDAVAARLAEVGGQRRARSRASVLEQLRTVAKRAAKR